MFNNIKDCGMFFACVIFVAGKPLIAGAGVWNFATEQCFQRLVLCVLALKVISKKVLNFRLRGIYLAIDV